MYPSFHFSPHVPERRAKGRPARSRSATGVNPSRRVLVVEDNLDAVHSLAFLLRQDGHIVEYAINGYVAVDIAKKFRPDIILLDLGLPGLEGFEVCSRLKGEPQLKHTRVVAVTAYNSDEDRIRSRAAGCDAHIPKPYDPQRLLAIVRDLE